MIIPLDFETYSTVELSDAGPTLMDAAGAAILWMSYQNPETCQVSLWSPFFGHFEGRKPLLEEMPDHETVYRRLMDNVAVFPFPEVLARHVQQGGWVQAHNINFDWSVWNTMADRYGMPTLPINQVLCTMEQTYYYGLPGALALAAPAIDSEIAKDLEGQKSMLICCKPGKPTKDFPYGKHCAPHLQWENGCYCYDDTLAMVKMIPKMPPHPIYRPDEARRIWATRRLNDRGIPINVEAVTDTLARVDEYKQVEEATFFDLTGLKASQSVKLREWFQNNGFPKCDGVGADKLAEMESMAPEGSDVLKAIQSARRLARKADAKLRVMLQHANADNRVRMSHQIYRSHTRRWAGVGIQPANMFTSKIKRLSGDNPLYDDLVKWCFSIMKRPDAVMILESEFKANFLDIVASMQRGFIQAPEGMVFYDADYSAVEARAVFYASRQENALKVFREGGDIYAYFAGEFLGKPVKKSDPERKLGKAPVLGLGFGMSLMGFVRHLIQQTPGFDQSKEYGVTSSEFLQDFFDSQTKSWRAQRKTEPRNFSRFPDAKAWEFGIAAYATYHRVFPNVRQLLEDIYESFMLVASRTANVTTVPVAGFIIGREDYGNISYVYAEFPTGGRMWFPGMEARRVTEQMPWGEKKTQWVIEYNRVVTAGTVRTKGDDADVVLGQYKGVKWVRHRFSKNEAIENCIQSWCSDFTSNSLCDIDDTGKFEPTMIVHDQVLSIGPAGLDELYRDLMFRPHPVDPGFPLDGSVDTFTNFCKG